MAIVKKLSLVNFEQKSVTDGQHLIWFMLNTFFMAVFIQIYYFRLFYSNVGGCYGHYFK